MAFSSLEGGGFVPERRSRVEDEKYHALPNERNFYFKSLEQKSASGRQ
jgi:hypothetical protein